jgi:hypothetical protein
VAYQPQCQYVRLKLISGMTQPHRAVAQQPTVQTCPLPKPRTPSPRCGTYTGSGCRSPGPSGSAGLQCGMRKTSKPVSSPWSCFIMQVCKHKTHTTAKVRSTACHLSGGCRVMMHVCKHTTHTAAIVRTIFCQLSGVWCVSCQEDVLSTARAMSALRRSPRQ